MKAHLTFTFILFLLSLQVVCAQESQSEAPYRGGSGDGYAMAELLVHAAPTAVDKELQKSVKLYPNPAKKGDQLIIESTSLLNISRICLLDAKGNLLFEGRAFGAQDEPISIPTRHWPAGVYFLQLESTQSTITKKLILL